MSKYKFVTGLVILIIFMSATFGTALTPVDGSKKTSSAGQSNTVSSPSQDKILKVVGFVAKISNNTLYLTNKKKYNLRRVKVTYNKGKKSPVNKKTAEMFFVNGVLKEVAIN